MTIACVTAGYGGNPSCESRDVNQSTTGTCTRSTRTSPASRCPPRREGLGQGRRAAAAAANACHTSETDTGLLQVI